MSVSEEGACLHAQDERRMEIMNEVHDIICPKENQAGPKAPFGFLGHINEQTACEAGSRALKARVCELMKKACSRRVKTKRG